MAFSDNWTSKLNDVVETALGRARIPGAALAIVTAGELAFANAYGFRDLTARLPMSARTAYPIASTTKAMNATLLGMLADEGRISWDAPVQDYLPGFSLCDPAAGARVTLRDLVVMRTGLPRHDWLWIDNPMQRGELVEALQHLEPSAGFRERFQYNNLTVTAAGHVAEVVTGRSWEALLSERILQPLGMSDTTFSRPGRDNVSLSYCETPEREPILTRRLATEVTGPSGGSIHSNVLDMARWMSFNLGNGGLGGRRLISREGLGEIQRPQIQAGSDPSAPSPNAAYAMGWFVDTYCGNARISHGGYLHDVNSEVMLFPDAGIGIVSFVNFGCSRLARFLNERTFELMLGLAAQQTIDERLARYESQIAAARLRTEQAAKVEGAAPSHELANYAGEYRHHGYGAFRIDCRDRTLWIQRHDLILQLEHWHDDAWVAAADDRFGIHAPHPFDRGSPISFETGPDGAVAAFTISLEPAVSRIRFAKLAGGVKDARLG